MIEIVIPTYKSFFAIQQMIACLALQTNKNFKAHIVVDGNENYFNQLTANISPHEDKFSFSLIDGPNNDWGHTAREYGLQNCTEDWIVMTGDDNYYVPTFIDEFSRAIESDNQTNFVYCDMLHNQYDYSYFKTTPNYNQIDIGCFAIPSHLGKLIPMEKTYAADGLFVEAYKSSLVLKPTKIDKALYIHN